MFAANFWVKNLGHNLLRDHLILTKISFFHWEIRPYFWTFFDLENALTTTLTCRYGLELICHFRYVLEYLIYHLRPFPNAARGVKGLEKHWKDMEVQTKGMEGQDKITEVDGLWDLLPPHFKNGSNPKWRDCQQTQNHFRCRCTDSSNVF